MTGTRINLQVLKIKKGSIPQHKDKKQKQAM
jgi:hypothetical protein